MLVPIWMTPDAFMDFASSKGLDLIWDQLGVSIGFSYDKEEFHHILCIKGEVHLVIGLAAVLADAGIEVPFTCSDGMPEA